MDEDSPVDHPLLYHWVRVRLDEQHWITGMLLRLSMSGDVDLLDEAGRTVYAWPGLEIEAA